ncbi:MAG TPA: CsbD family protein [Terriglobales bacterium]|nr:CsbD family protein [Terriglobales bacterium]
MDKNRIKGKMDEIAGRAKRQAGEWTGDTQAQGQGTVDEIKGRAENAWGKVKDSARNVKDDMDKKDRERNAA